MVARDGGVPSLIDTAIVHVHVNRNNFAPRFDRSDYRETILETQALGVPITVVTAQDQDEKVQYVRFPV